MGFCIVAGGNPDMAAHVTGILASDLAVGSIVKLMENGVATEYLVVNHGKPSGSSLYDDSCDGLWLLRKDIKENRQWHSSKVNDYRNSTIYAWLNGDFFNLFGSVDQAVIKQVKIPYVNGASGSSIASGANGLPTKVFLLGGYEVDVTQSWISSVVPIDGAALSYFSGINSGDANSKRIAYLNGSEANWFLRSGSVNDTTRVLSINTRGGAYTGPTTCSDESGIRPALILPFNALFDAQTLILKGVV